MSDTYGFYFGQPWWLLAVTLVLPLVWLSLRNLAPLGSTRRVMAIGLRVLVILLLVVLLARPMLVRKSHRVTVLAVMDRSRSIPEAKAQWALDYLSNVAARNGSDGQFAVVDVAETANIASLPSVEPSVRRRSTTLSGHQSRLAGGVEMAMAIAPPDTATRIVLVSEGNETEGDLKEVARTAAANKIAIDVLPLRYRYDSEVLFRRLVAPSRARSGQTIDLRFLLDSTAAVRGKLLLTLNDRPLDLVPDSNAVAVPVELVPGTNVKTVSVPVGLRGIHMFEAVFLPDDSRYDRIIENNRATAVTYVAGPGHVRIFDTEGAGEAIERALSGAEMQASRDDVALLPNELIRLLDADAIVLVNTPIHHFSMAQQEMLCRYVNDLGGGLIMVGGPESFGAGGWIGSPVAEILPVDLDPPQKKQMPKGALVLVIDRSGSMVGDKVEICKVAAESAVRLLSRLDRVGVIAFDARYDWLVPLQQANDKDAINEQVRGIGAGGGTIMGPAMREAFESIRGLPAGIKHVILLTDGITSDRDYCMDLAMEMAESRVSVSTLAVGEHSDTQLLNDIAEVTEGRFYYVKDPMSIPEIFVKEAQVVRRSMIIEQDFTPQLVYSMSEAVKGIGPVLPQLNGFVLTGPKGGLNQVVMTSHEGDPILATCQSGLGRCVAFTSSADTRWAANWLAWGDFKRFWEQTVRWVGKPTQSADCEIFADVQGHKVTVNVEAFDEEGRFLQFAGLKGQVLMPGMDSETLSLNQKGPGQYTGHFDVPTSGSYIVNLQYQKIGADAETRLANTVVTIPFAPEFRDLSDNAPLLEEISHITGGRVLPNDPNEADLYDRAGLSFPETSLPLLRPLMLIWLALFLLDVAVRRVVLDLRAMVRRVRGWLTSAVKRGEKDETISRLQARRQKIREQLSARAAQAVVSRRYDGAQKYDGDILGAEPTQEFKAPERPKRKEAPAEKQPVRPASHIDELLKIKRRRAGEDTD